MANFWLKTFATGHEDDFLNNPIIEGLSTDTRAQASMQNILGAAAEQGSSLDWIIDGPDNPAYEGKDADYVFEQEFKTNGQFRDAVIESAVNNPEARQDLLASLKGMEQEELDDLNEQIADAENGSEEWGIAMEKASVATNNINALDKVSTILDSEAATTLMAAEAGKTQVANFLKDFANKAVDGDVSPQDQQELQQAHQGLIDAGVQLAISDPESLGTLAESVKGLAQTSGVDADVVQVAAEASAALETTASVLQNPVLQAVQTAQPQAFSDLATTLTNKEISGDVTPQDVLSGINANPALSASLVSAAVANPAAFKNLLDNGPAGAETSELDVSGYANIRNAAVDAAMANPSAVGTLVETLGIENAAIEQALPVLENEFVQDILAVDPSLAYKMADPANGGNYQKVIEDHIQSNPDLLKVAHQSLQENPDAAGALNSLVGGNLDYESMLGEFSDLNQNEVQALVSNVKKGQTLEMAAVGVVVDPIITLASNNMNPDAHLQAGEQFVDALADKIGIDNATALANVQALKLDRDLMQDIGADFAKNGAEIKSVLPDLLAPRDSLNKDQLARIDKFMSEHTELIQAAVPIIAANDPKAAAEMAMKGMEQNLLSSAETAADKQYISSTLESVRNTPGFMDDLGARLADVQVSGQIIENMSTLDSVAGSGDRMRMVLDDLKENPTEVMDLISSKHMTAHAIRRYSDDLMGQMSMAGVEGIQGKLKEFADSDGAQKFREMTGVDIGGMLNGFGNKLPGFAKDFEDHMKLKGAELSNDALNFSVMNGWMGGFGAGNNMEMGNDSIFGPLMHRFDKHGSGMYITNEAQLANTDGVGNVDVKGMDQWADNQARVASARIDEVTGKMTWVDPNTGDTHSVQALASKDGSVQADPDAAQKMEALGWS